MSGHGHLVNLATVCVVSCLAGQARAELGGGPRAVFGWTGLSGDTIATPLVALETDRQSGMGGGLFGDVEVSPWLGLELGLQIDVLVVRAGAAVEATFLDFARSSRWVLTYLEAPVAIRPGWRVGPVGAFALAGVAPALILFAHESVDGDYGALDLDERIERWDIAWLVGGGVGFDVPAGRLLVDVRYTVGTRAVVGSNALEELGGLGVVVRVPRYENRSIAVTMGFSFRP